MVEPWRVEEIDERLKHSTESGRLRRGQVIRGALVHPKPAAEIALERGFARQMVHHRIAAYNRPGPAALATPGRGQRQRAYLSLEQAQAVIAPFLQSRAAGQRRTGLPLKAALEEAMGHPVAKSTVYRLLKRHRWRQAFPGPVTRRSEQDAFKQNFPAPVQTRRQARDPPDRRSVIVMAQDAGRFGRLDRPRRWGAPQPLRPHAPGQVGREFVYVFGCGVGAAGAFNSFAAAHRPYREEGLVSGAGGSGILRVRHS